jgi:uncharacterized membrane protein YhfC
MPRSRLAQTCVAFFALIVALALAACAPSPSPFAPAAPWSDGETSHYDVLGHGDAPKGTASWTWTKQGDGWRESFEIATGGKRDHRSVDLSPQLAPKSSRSEQDGAIVEAEYGEATISVRTTAKGGERTEKSVARPADPVDNEASLQVQRGLPLAPGWATAYTDVIPKTAATARIELSVVGEEQVTVPAGTFAAWHVKMSTSMVSQEAWYAKDAPHLLLRYKNAGGASTFALRSWKATPDGALHGSAEPSPPPRPAAAPVPLSVALLLTSLLVQIPLMIALPIALGARLARRYGCGWRPWGAGALAFVLSQVVHLPFNWATGLMGGGRGLGLLPLPLLALAGGLSAGLCEEIARYLMLRYGLRRARSFREAVQFGVGHGGIEAIILGVLAAIALVAMIVLRAVPAASLGIQGDAATQVADATNAFWSKAWYTPMMGGLERVFAITAHVAMSVMVMRAVVRGRVRWLLAAIAAHAALDGFAVLGMSRLGVMGVEVGAGIFALFFAWTIWAMRDGAPATGTAAAP